MQGSSSFSDGLMIWAIIGLGSRSRARSAARSCETVSSVCSERSFAGSLAVFLAILISS